MAVDSLLRPLLLLLLLIILIVSFPLVYSAAESEALLNFKKSLTDTNNALASWVSNSIPCDGKTRWDGLVCFNGIVTSLRLGGMGLSGKIDVSALIGLRGLRTLSFSNNNFSGRIPEFNRLGALKAIYLSGNQFSGDIASDFFAKMESLKKLWLSDNKFSGIIPSSLAQLPYLIELHLENNQFSGAIPTIDRPTLMSLDVSNNKLEGEIPEGLSRFNASSFVGNDGLCGGKSGKLCNEKVVGEPFELDYGNGVSDDLNIGATKEDSKKTVLGVSTLAILLLFVAAVVVVKAKRKEEDDFDRIGKDAPEEAFEVHVSVTVPARKEPEIVTRKSGSSRKGSSRGKAGGNNRLGELVIVNDEKGSFGLTDLMKSAAEVLGNGALGSSYKATMANGVTVVVKRIREMNAMEKTEFEAESRKLASFRHPNLLTPLAFHYRKEEKLMVYEYIPKGSLLYLLHGDRGPSHAELNWPSRLRIIQGIAKGLGHLQTELASHALPHGNLKSSNVLLGPENVPLLTDFGYNRLASQSILAQALFAYKAPEVARYGQVSPKCDVYCLGIIILEIVTGKFPVQYLCNGKGGTDVVQWVASAIYEGRESELIDPKIASNYNALGEMEKLLHIGAACTETNPKRRLDVREAIARIESVKFEDSKKAARTMEVLPSLRDGYADSVHANMPSFRNRFGEQSGRRHEVGASEDPTLERNANSFAFSVT
ncbi:hypothetical protein HS088_TW17G01034 [Tripterygium wilfordii]|uniref:Protein kinase domain-containing protein n=1 Tax=Tripterygium wilfordii TaxID=458696 RepID=A0A7J7CHF4_TRIWF|nr:pollen receptor-like kinase 3 [Tripterygium wilfordii]KAF5733490.1 hypothetical protein HS088_TW17G01034 [Tripterygium wilfordii]